MTATTTAPPKNVTNAPIWNHPEWLAAVRWAACLSRVNGPGGLGAMTQRATKTNNATDTTASAAQTYERREGWVEAREPVIRGQATRPSELSGRPCNVLGRG